MPEISSFSDFSRPAFPSTPAENAVDTVVTRDRVDEATENGTADVDQLLSVCLASGVCEGIEQDDLRAAVTRLCEVRGVPVASKVDETVVLRATPPKLDLSTKAKSITHRVQDLIGRMAIMSFEGIRDEFSAILADENTHASDGTRNKWKEIVQKARGKVDIMRSITNLYLKGSGLGIE